MYQAKKMENGPTATASYSLVMTGRKHERVLQQKAAWGDPKKGAGCPKEYSSVLCTGWRSLCPLSKHRQGLQRQMDRG